MFVYADDTGDSGTGGSGRTWLSYAAFVVPDACITNAMNFRDQAAALMPGASGDPANWHAHERDADDVIGTLRMMVDAPFDWCWLAVNSSTDHSTPQTAKIIHEPAEHRYYVLLWLLERISWLAESRNEQAAVFIERCGGLDEDQLQRRYANGLPQGRGAAYAHLPSASIRVAQPINEPLLNLADTLAYAVGKAVNPHLRRGETFPEYLRTVWPKVWVGPVWNNCGLTTYGFALLPSTMNAQLVATLPFVSEWRASLGLTF